MRLLWAQGHGQDFLGDVSKLVTGDSVAYVGSKASCVFAAERLKSTLKGRLVETFTAHYKLPMEDVLSYDFIIIEVKTLSTKSRVGMKLLELFWRRDNVVLREHTCRLLRFGLYPAPLYSPIKFVG